MLPLKSVAQDKKKRMPPLRLPTPTSTDTTDITSFASDWPTTMVVLVECSNGSLCTPSDSVSTPVSRCSRMLLEDTSRQTSIIYMSSLLCIMRGADLHMAQRMPLPLTVSCSSKIQIGFSFLLLVHPGSPGQRAVKWVCVCVCTMQGI